MTNAAEQTVHHKPATAADWSVWIAQQLADRAANYLRTPALLVSDANGEIALAREYHGRELLELLQNIDDAGGDAHDGCRAQIVLTEDGVCVANTGRIFDARGVESLLYHHTSAKALDRRRFIGNKGLGFRALLNWTDAPLILSGALALGFHQQYARAWLAALTTHADAHNLRARVAEQHTAVAGGAPLIATLAVPYALDALDAPTDPASIRLVDIAQQLRADGYDTVIVLPLASAKHKQAHQFITALGPEGLLFLRHVHELTITTAASRVTWRCERTDTQVTILRTDTAPQVWRIDREVGELPAEMRNAETGYDYAIAIARLVDGTRKSSKLVSYLPTAIPFPFPVIAHVTAELTSDRNALRDTPANRFVLTRLAERLVAVALEGAAQNSWEPLLFFKAAPRLDARLTELQFDRALRAAIVAQPVVPTISGAYMKPGEIHRLVDWNAQPVAPDPWLPAAHFPHTLQTLPDAIARGTEILDWLDVRKLTPAQLVKLLNEPIVALALTIDERASLIANVRKIVGSTFSGGSLPRLLIDQHGAILKNTSTVMLLPAVGMVVPLPPAVEIQFLHAELAKALYVACDKHTPEALTEWLNHQEHGYHLKPYTLAALALQICVAANVNTPADNAQDRWRQARQTLFALWQQPDSTDPSPEMTMLLPTIDGQLAPARTLYFGTTYPDGQITGALYANLTPAPLVVASADLDLAADDSDIADFLRWCGVETQPRMVLLPAAPKPDQYLQYVVGHLRFPARFANHDEDIADADAFDLSRLYITDASTIDRLAEILECADVAAILAWLAGDDRAMQWERGDSKAQLEYLFLSKVKVRRLLGASLPAHTRWLLATTAWLPTTDGVKTAPQYCVLGRLSDELRARFPQPAKISVREGGDWQRALRSAGVAAKFDDLTLSVIYDVLRQLPASDPAGTSARPFYTAILEREDELGSTTLRRKFHRDGMLWSQHNGVAAYRPVATLRHLTRADLPHAVEAALPLLDLAPRFSGKLVTSIFGVRALAANAVRVVLSDGGLVSHRDHARFAQHCAKIVLLLAILRTRDQDRLAKIQFQLCTQVSFQATLPDDTRAVTDTLNQANETLVIDTTIYLIVPETLTPRLEDALVAEALSAAIAAYLGIIEYGDIARLVMCADTQRVALLAKLLPGSEIDEVALTVQIAEMRTKLFMPEEPESDQQHTHYYQPPPPAYQQVVTVIPASLPDPAPVPLPPTATIQAEFIGQLAPGIPRHIALRISPSASAAVAGSPQTRMIEEDSLRIVCAFEEQQGRFPLQVAHLQGEAGYGCDIISFAHASERPSADRATITSIARFIEVKQSASGHVTLTKNEQAAALLYDHRYYVYRLDGADPSYTLDIVVDPLSIDRVHNPISIDLTRAVRDQWNINLVV